MLLFINYRTLFFFSNRNWWTRSFVTFRFFRTPGLRQHQQPQLAANRRATVSTNGHVLSEISRRQPQKRLHFRSVNRERPRYSPDFRIRLPCKTLNHSLSNTLFARYWDVVTQILFYIPTYYLFRPPIVHYCIYINLVYNNLCIIYQYVYNIC